MANVIFKLKNPQKGVKPSNQKESLIFMYFSYGYFETDLQGKKKYLPLKYSTGISVLPSLWNDKPTYRIKNTIKIAHEGYNTRLDILEALIKDLYNNNKGLSPDKLRELLDKAIKGETVEPITFGLYIDKYITETENGARLTQKGDKFKLGTTKTFRAFESVFNRFQKKQNRKYNFNDINIDFYYDFVGYMTTVLNYSPNTIGRTIKHLKIMMRQAREEGLHNNLETERKAFKILNKKVENIYLNEKELNILARLDLSNKPNYELARDVFLVGCYTAQRYSDYSKINKNNIKNGFIDLIQKKTGERVIIPMRPELKAILQKYDYTLPKTHEQKINLYIKAIGKLAGFTEIIQTEKTKGGLIVKENIPKHQLIMTHTARRSGATNMYLAGIQSIDIMKITGHKTESEFLKYIKVTKEETAQNLALHPYFNTPVLKAN